DARIRELISLGTWPNGWAGDEPTADTPMDAVFADGSIQPLLMRGERCSGLTTSSFRVDIKSYVATANNNSGAVKVLRFGRRRGSSLRRSSIRRWLNSMRSAAK